MGPRGTADIEHTEYGYFVTLGYWNSSDKRSVSVATEDEATKIADDFV
jgi:hypothetical protein